MEIDVTKVAKEIVQTLIKSRKNLRMYPENNPIYIKTIDNAYRTFMEYLDSHDALVLRIKQHEIIHDGEQVYYKPEKDDNIALFFFKDGIRELTFRNGLKKDELEDFFKIIMHDFEDETGEDDVVTLMWERDFQNISYIVDETFLTDDEEYEDIATQQAKDGAAGENEIMQAYQEADGMEAAVHVPIASLTGKDIEKLKDDLDKDAGYYITKLSTLLFEMLYLSEKKEDYQEVVSFFRSSIDFALQNNYVELAAQSIRKINALLNSTDCPEIMKPSLRYILSYINSDRVIKLLGELLDSKTEIDEEAANEFFPLMDRTAIPALIKTLGELETIHARKIIINSLIILGKKDVASVAKGLNDKRWYVVRNIIYVLRNIKDKRAIEYLTKKLRHNDIRVRKEVIKALGDLGGAEVVNYLRGFIKDSDAAIRGLTAKSLGQTSSPLAKRVLFEEIENSGFKGKDFAEKKEFFEAIATWKDRDILSFLYRILKKGALFRRGKVNESRAGAAYALGLVGSPEALALLQKFQDVKIDVIREHINAAMKRIQHGSAAERT